MGLNRNQALQDTADLNLAAQNDLLNTILPQLNASIAGSGASGDAMAALLRSNAASNLAANVAKQRADTVAKYEQVGVEQQRVSEIARHNQAQETIARDDQKLRDILNQRDNATQLQIQDLVNQGRLEEARLLAENRLQVQELTNQGNYQQALLQSDTQIQLQGMRGQQALEQLLTQYTNDQNLLAQQQHNATLDMYNQAQIQRFNDMFAIPDGAGTGDNLPANSQDNPYSWVFGG